MHITIMAHQSSVLLSCTSARVLSDPASPNDQHTAGRSTSSHTTTQRRGSASRLTDTATAPTGRNRNGLNGAPADVNASIETSLVALHKRRVGYQRLVPIRPPDRKSIVTHWDHIKRVDILRDRVQIVRGRATESPQFYRRDRLQVASVSASLSQHLHRAA